MSDIITVQVPRGAYCTDCGMFELLARRGIMGITRAKCAAFDLELEGEVAKGLITWLKCEQCAAGGVEDGSS